MSEKSTSGAPQRPEHNLEARDGQSVGHDVTADQAVEAGVRDAGVARNGAEAPVPDGIAEAHDEHPQQLVGGVLKDNIRPAVGELDGLRPLLANHPLSIRGAATASDESGNVRAVGYNYSHSHLIDKYIPKMPREQWNAISDFVRSAVRQVPDFTEAMTMRALRAVADYAHWANDRGYPVDHALFDDDMLEHYLVKLRRSRGSDQLQPSTLLKRVATAVRGVKPSEVTSASTLNARVPYTEHELNLAYQWACAGRTVRSRHNLMTYFVVAASTGLRLAEIGDLTLDRIIDHGTHIEVIGNRPRRSTVVLAEYEDLLRPLTAARSGETLLWDHMSAAPSRNQMWNYLRSTKREPLRPSAERLRVTWLVHHLQRGTPIDVLVAAAGTDVVTISRYLPHIHRDPATATAWLRGETNR